MKIQESGENYLETILILKRNKSVVRSIDVAEELGYAKSSVSRAMGILKNAGFITVDANGAIDFTLTGKVKAEGMYERHRTITDFLIGLGVDPDTAEQDACRIEHVLSDKTYSVIKERANIDIKLT